MIRKSLCNYVSTGENCCADYRSYENWPSFELVEHLEHQHLCVRLYRKWPEKENFLLKSTVYSCSEKLMREIAKKLKISYNGVDYSLQRTAQMGSNQNRKRSGRPRCTTKQEDKYIRVSSLRNRRLTGPQLPASLNGTRKTPVSTSTVKRRLRDAGLLGRVAKKKPYLRLTNSLKYGQRKIGKKCYGQTNLSLRCLDHTEEHLFF